MLSRVYSIFTPSTDIAEPRAAHVAARVSHFTVDGRTTSTEGYTISAINRKLVDDTVLLDEEHRKLIINPDPSGIKHSRGSQEKQL